MYLKGTKPSNSLHNPSESSISCYYHHFSVTFSQSRKGSLHSEGPHSTTIAVILKVKNHRILDSPAAKFTTVIRQWVEGEPCKDRRIQARKQPDVAQAPHSIAPPLRFKLLLKLSLQLGGPPIPQSYCTVGAAATGDCCQERNGGDDGCAVTVPWRCGGARRIPG